MNKMLFSRVFVVFCCVLLGSALGGSPAGLRGGDKTNSNAAAVTTSDIAATPTNDATSAAITEVGVDAVATIENDTEITAASARPPFGTEIVFDFPLDGPQDQTIYMGENEVVFVRLYGSQGTGYKWRATPSKDAVAVSTIFSAPIEVLPGGRDVTVFGVTAKRVGVATVTFGYIAAWSPYILDDSRIARLHVIVKGFDKVQKSRPTSGATDALSVLPDDTSVTLPEGIVTADIVLPGEDTTLTYGPYDKTRDFAVVFGSNDAVQRKSVIVDDGSKLRVQLQGQAGTAYNWYIARIDSYQAKLESVRRYPIGGGGQFGGPVATEFTFTIYGSSKIEFVYRRDSDTVGRQATLLVVSSSGCLTTPLSISTSPNDETSSTEPVANNSSETTSGQTPCIPTGEAGVQNNACGNAVLFDSNEEQQRQSVIAADDSTLRVQLRGQAGTAYYWCLALYDPEQIRLESVTRYSIGGGGIVGGPVITEFIFTVFGSSTLEFVNRAGYVIGRQATLLIASPRRFDLGSSSAGLALDSSTSLANSSLSDGLPATADPTSSSLSADTVSEMSGSAMETTPGGPGLNKKRDLVVAFESKKTVEKKTVVAEDQSTLRVQLQGEAGSAYRWYVALFDPKHAKLESEERYLIGGGGSFGTRVATEFTFTVTGSSEISFIYRSDDIAARQATLLIASPRNI